MSPLLEIENLKVWFATNRGNVPAVRGVSLSISRGETLGLVGESGSGKSATALACLKLLKCPPSQVSAAKMIFQGKDLLSLPEKEMQQIRGNEIAMVFQDPMSSLNPYLTIERQLSEVLEVHRGLSRSQARGPCLEALRQVGIPDPESRIDGYPHQLSGGQRQRVMIAMALLCKPALLIVDEPTTALDVTVQAQILELLKALQRETGMAMLLITHDLGVIASLAHRTAVMYAGRIAEEGPTASIFEKPSHPYTRGLLDSLPGISKRLRAIPGNPPDPLETLPGCAFEPRCEFRVELCKKEIPPFFKVGEGRLSACFEHERVR